MPPTAAAAGLPVKRAEALRREFIHAYGARHISTLTHLQARSCGACWLLLQQRMRLTWRPRAACAQTAGLLPPISASGASPLSAALGAAAAGVAGARGAAAAAAAVGGAGGGAAAGFAAARGPLKLCVEGLNDAAPDDIAYTYSHSGCAPSRTRTAALATTFRRRSVRADAALLRCAQLRAAVGAAGGARGARHVARAQSRGRFQGAPGPLFRATAGAG
jgi:hypothetical protein